MPAVQQHSILDIKCALLLHQLLTVIIYMNSEEGQACRALKMAVLGRMVAFYRSGGLRISELHGPGGRSSHVALR